VKVLLKWVAIAVVAVFLAFVAINLLDEDLDPQAAAYGKPRAAKVPDAENGYYAMLAMDASDGADGAAYAKAWLDEARAAARDGRRPKPPAREQAKRPELCEPRESSCLTAFRGKGGQAAQELEPFREDLARYETLLGFKQFEEVLDYPFGPDSEIPRYAPMARTQRAYLLRVTLDIEAGRVEEGVAALERELAWQRLLLAESRMLISKMVAAAGYWRDLSFIANLLETRSAELARFLPRLRTMLAPIDARALSLAQAVETEFGFAVASYSQISKDREGGWDAESWYLGGPLLYKPNATTNHLYRYYTALNGSVFGAPAHRVAAEWDAFSAAWHDFRWWRSIYNPVGKILLSVSMPAWNDYPLRLHDLDALSRLVALRVELLASAVMPERVAETVASSDRRFHDPYTGKPMRWDAERKRLYFEAGSKRIKEFKDGVERGRVFVSL
jgi:hypothetical protein